MKTTETKYNETNYKEIMDLFFSYSISDNNAYYSQNVKSPFLITQTTVHASDVSNKICSVLSPIGHYNTVIPFPNTIDTDKMHYHNCFEFAYVVSGNMYQIVEGKRYYYTPGSCILINRNTLHTECHDTDYTCIFFTISREFVKSLTNYGNEMLFPLEQNRFQNHIFEFLTTNSSASHIDTKDFLDFIPLITEKKQKKLVHDIFEQMYFTLLNPYYGATYNLRNLFLKLVDILCNPQYYNIVHVSPRTKMDSFLFARIDHILEERHGLIKNEDLAELLNYNASYLGKIVKKFTNQSLYDYRMSFTMTYVAEQLKTTSKNITEISLEVNFSNRTHFYKIFHQYFHMTPNAYRTQHQSHSNVSNTSQKTNCQ